MDQRAAQTAITVRGGGGILFGAEAGSRRQNASVCPIVIIVTGPNFAKAHDFYLQLAFEMIFSRQPILQQLWRGGPASLK